LVGNVACVGEMKNAYKILVENRKGLSEDLGVDGKILQWILVI